ncbi:Bifunctional peptidase and (3S)-lysyl hydroxylase JMJD7 [Lamellibrachia satsuma]|nr:Bifunctional peptidase and (3S)-lysyl hydroxylase JMJD7 [Lamellibrachia satsuma]
MEARDLYLDKAVKVLNQPPSPLEFHKDWVAANRPVVIKGVIDHWPALTKWNTQYLREKIGTKNVTVTVTPSGYADAVHGDRFMMPEERHMPLSECVDILEGETKSNGIFYIQKQNSNFMDEFSDLIPDAEEHIPWATEALGRKPDAVNFWIGDERAVTSMHKDHYENLYCVVSGHKTFTLLPPTDQPFVPYEEYQAAVYKENTSGQFEIIDDNETGKVPWIPIDPLKPDLERYPMYREARPVTVTVHAGETLYLPSLWYHHVQQSHCCIAVNFWYDMEYDIKYNYFKFVECLKRRADIF